VHARSHVRWLLLVCLLWTPGCSDAAGPEGLSTPGYHYTVVSAGKTTTYSGQFGMFSYIALGSANPPQRYLWLDVGDSLTFVRLAPDSESLLNTGTFAVIDEVGWVDYGGLVRHVGVSSLTESGSITFESVAPARVRGRFSFRTRASDGLAAATVSGTFNLVPSPN
jgi:hypothetical protein